MTSWERVEALVAAALQRPPDERAAFVHTNADDADTAAEVLSLIDAHERAGGFLAPPQGGPERPGGQAEPPAARPDVGPGARIGRYELVREIGRGGMGAVFLARRVDGVVAHDVAVKLIGGAFAGSEALRRFTAERGMLAALSHPHIVAFIDGGTTPAGVPYLITEYVDGVPVTTFVEARQASLEERLRLFRQICGGVHAAHRSGIVHRDVKPANILVTADGLPKILDFGIATLLDEHGVGTTRAMGLPGPLTPNYASPEQLRGRPVTTSSDVYGLGVLLYELLTGQRPREAAGRPLDELLRELDRPIERPSVTAMRAGVPYAARLVGDLDAVVLKALRDDPAERYASADELSADIARTLGGLPVAAREPSLGYVLGKLIARHRLAASIALVAALGVLTALGVALWQWRDARQARAAAEARFQEVRQLANALIFKLDDVMRTESPTVARRALVNEALQYLDRLGGVSTDATLALEMAAAYRRVAEIQGGLNSNLGDVDGAIRSLRRALDVLTTLERTGAARGQVLGALSLTHASLAQVLAGAGQRSEDARAAATSALDAARRWVEVERTDASRRTLASAYFTMAVHTAEVDGKRSALESAMREFDALLQERPDDVGRMRNVALMAKNLASLLDIAGDASTRRRYAERAVALDVRRLAQRPTERQARLDAAISYAEFAAALDVPSERRVPYERSLELREQVLREDPADRFARTLVRRSRAQVASMRLELGDLDGADAAARGALELFDPDDDATLPRGERRWQAVAHITLARLGERRGQRGAACGHLQEAERAGRAAGAELGPATTADLKATRALLPGGCPTDTAAPPPARR